MTAVFKLFFSIHLIMNLMMKDKVKGKTIYYIELTDTLTTSLSQVTGL